MMKLKLTTLTFVVLALFSCGGGDSASKENALTEAVENASPADPMSDKGVGPVTSVEIAADVDATMAAEGEKIFTAKCTACHKIGKKYIGPDLTGVTKIQSPEWIMNMILNPEVMIVQNETAKQLLMKFTAPMANQNLTKEEARSVYEFFRTKN